MTAHEVCSLAEKDLVPRLAKGSGLVRYSLLMLTDGRFGSFSVYESQDDAKAGQAIAGEWVKRTDAMEGYKLDETLEGPIGFAIQQDSGTTGRLFAVARIYPTSASMERVRTALDQEAIDIIRSLPGLVRYTIAQLSDRRIGVFSAFDTKENAENLSQQAKRLRARAGSQIAQVFPNEPRVIEGMVRSTYAAP
jgi:hypothetical protein